jgi:hypothetical protein
MRFPLRSIPIGLLLVACSTVRTVQPTELRPPQAPTRVWVTRADRSTVVFDSARVSADSLIGVVNGSLAHLALSEATELRAREPSEARTAALALSVGGVAGALVLYMAETQSGGGEPPCCPDGINPGCCRPPL